MTDEVIVEGQQSRKCFRALPRFVVPFGGQSPRGPQPQHAHKMMLKRTWTDVPVLTHPSRLSQTFTALDPLQLPLDALFEAVVMMQRKDRGLVIG